jgi:hypothetical protein
MQTRQTGHLTMLDPVVAALRKHGMKARHECPGYIQVDGHDFVYAPSPDYWSHIHTKDTRGPWTRLLEQGECDTEQIADRILAHILSQREVL